MYRLTTILLTTTMLTSLLRSSRAFVSRGPATSTPLRHALSHGSPSQVLWKSTSSTTTSTTASSMSLSPTELDSLQDRIQQKGDEIRNFKANGMDKTALAPHIEELLALKAQLPSSQNGQEEKAQQQNQKSKPKKQKSSKQGGGGTKKEPVEMTESELRLNRLSKVEAMKQAGVEPFEYSFVTTHTAQQLLARYNDVLEAGQEDEGADVAVAGRIMTRRVFGKLAFFTLQDESGTIQLQFDKKRLEDEFKVKSNKLAYSKQHIFVPLCLTFEIHLIYVGFRISKTGPMEVTLWEYEVQFERRTREN